MDRGEPTPLLEPEQERLLARTIEAGVLAGHLLASGERPVPATSDELDTLVRAGERAYQHFLLANVRLVGLLASREARKTGLPTDELFQEGFVALADALQRFDPARGRFSTFATVRIRQHLAEAAATRFGELALPASRALGLRRARRWAEVLGQERGRSLAADELAAALGRPAEATRRLLDYRAPVAVDAAAEIIADPVAVDPDAAIYARQFRRVLNQLDAGEAEVLRLRYGITTGEPVGVVETAAALGLSPSSVRRLERRGLAALRALSDRFDPTRDDPIAG